MRLILSALTLLALAVPALAQDSGTAKPNPPVLKEITPDFPKGNRLEYRVLTATLDPGTSSPWHTHAAPVAVYVVSGEFTLETSGSPDKTIKAGKSLLEPVDVKVRAANHGNEPAKVVIFQVSGPQQPFLTPTE